MIKHKRIIILLITAVLFIGLGGVLLHHHADDDGHFECTVCRYVQHQALFHGFSVLVFLMGFVLLGFVVLNTLPFYTSATPFAQFSRPPPLVG